MWIRPGSESWAELHVGILGTCEGLNLPEETLNGMNPSEQRPGLQPAFPGAVRAKQWKETGYRSSSSRQEYRDGTSGRLSRLIVAFESRETLLGEEPVSSQGGRSEYNECDWATRCGETAAYKRENAAGAHCTDSKETYGQSTDHTESPIWICC